MHEEIQDFIDALESYINTALRESLEPAEYTHEALEIVDARNHLFRSAGERTTDEEANIYALRDLLHIDVDTLETQVNRARLRAVARNYFND
nr:hypothetical protein [uncultured Alloprevotella sp.]